MVPAASAQRLQFRGQRIGLDVQGGEELVQKIAQLGVGGHHLEYLAKERPYDRIGIRDEQQNRPLFLLDVPQRLVAPPPPKDALFPEVRCRHRLERTLRGSEERFRRRNQEFAFRIVRRIASPTELKCVLPT